MPEYKRLIAANMRAMLDWFGCLDAAASTINARWGGGASKGTLSKKANGLLDWSVVEVMALEDARGEYPITRMMARRQKAAPPIAEGGLVESSASLAKESGEALAAILAAQQSECAQDYAQAIKETDEAICAMHRARDLLEQRLKASSTPQDAHPSSQEIDF